MRQDIDNYRGSFKDILLSALERIGKKFNKCELCGKSIKQFDIHHTRYVGATICDLLIVCRRCNTQQENRYLQ